MTLHAFEGVGLEIEYALVDRASLDVTPIADRVLQALSGTSGPVNDYRKGEFGWSNAFVMHALELKNVAPTPRLDPLGRMLHDEVRTMNATLERFGARLMPGGMHPWFDAAKETRLWPHDHGLVYRAYDRIFDCRRQGWANLQSTHVNLPFASDGEFARLHAALRLIVPILPALAAASPYVEGRAPGALDFRMEAYRRNAEAVPQLNGDIVPEPVMSRADYRRDVLEPIYRGLQPHDADGVLQAEWINARGVIARFDRSALEIRVLDTQEAPGVDVAFAAFLIDLAQSLYERECSRPARETQLPTRLLADIFVRCVHDAERAQIESGEFLALFGLARATCSAGDLWSAIAERLERENAPHAGLWRREIEFVTSRGPLARRLLRAIGPRPDRRALHELYSALCDALHDGRQFDP